MDKLRGLFIFACIFIALATYTAAQDATESTTTTTTTAGPPSPSSFSIGGINLGGNRGNPGQMPGIPGQMPPILIAKLNFIRQGLESLRNGTNQLGNTGRSMAGSGLGSLASYILNALRPQQRNNPSDTTGSSPLDALNPAAILGNLAG